MVRLTEVVFEHLKAKQADRVYLPSSEAALLVHQLELLGIGADRLSSTLEDRRNCVLRILRSPTAGDEKQGEGQVERYLGLQLKRVLAVIRLAEGQP